MSARGWSVWRAWLVATLLGRVALGCQSTGLPQDPLLVSKKPVESKPELSPPVVIAYSEPSVPQEPSVALARRSRTRPGEASTKATKAVPSVLATTPSSSHNSAGLPAAHPRD
jgi:hypothetical protein